jgi:hypothetical protein
VWEGYTVQDNKHSTNVELALAGRELSSRLRSKGVWWGTRIWVNVGMGAWWRPGK